MILSFIKIIIIIIIHLWFPLDVETVVLFEFLVLIYDLAVVVPPGFGVLPVSLDERRLLKKSLAPLVGVPSFLNGKFEMFVFLRMVNFYKLLPLICILDESYESYMPSRSWTIPTFFCERNCFWSSCYFLLIMTCASLCTSDTFIGSFEPMKSETSWWWLFPDRTVDSTVSAPSNYIWEFSAETMVEGTPRFLGDHMLLRFGSFTIRDVFISPKFLALLLN